MNIQKHICEAFCDGFRTKEIPIGYSITTPFTWLEDEPLVIYARKEDGLLRIEDNGGTFVSLEDLSGDLSSETRADTVRELAFQNRIIFDEENFQFYTGWSNENEIGSLVINFLSFMNRLQDMQFFSKKRIENTFKDDLFQAINERFSKDYVVRERYDITVGYTTDFSITSRNNGKTAAIYTATAEVKVLEALLAAELIAREQRYARVIPFLVYEDLFSSKITKRNRTRCMNNEILEVTDWSKGEGKSEAFYKIEHIINKAA